MPNPQPVKVWLLKPTGRPFYQLQWRDPATNRLKTESTKTADPVAASQKRDDREYELRHGLYAEPGKMPWEKFREVYLNEKYGADTAAAEAHARTIEKAESVFDRFEEIVSPANIGDIDERTLSTYAAKLRGKGYSAYSISGHLAGLKAALRWAHAQKIIADVPRIVMPKLPKGRTQAKIAKAAKISTEAYERLLMKAPSTGWQILIALAWHCGLRRNEAHKVRGADVDLDAGEIVVAKNKARDESQTAIITPELEVLLRETWPDGLPEGPIVNDVPTAETEVSRQFEKIAVKATVPGTGKNGWCTLHDLRRSYGSRWAGKVPAQVLKSMMRHANITTTLNFYADAKDAAKAAVRGGKPTSLVAEVSRSVA